MWNVRAVAFLIRRSMWQPINRRGLGGGVLLVLLTLPPALLNMAALWAPPWLYRRIAQEREKNTALQRVRFSHFFLRIRDRQNRYRIGRRGPGYSLTLCCRTATKTGKGLDEREWERWFLEIPYGARLAHRWGDTLDIYLYYGHNRSSDCLCTMVPVRSLVKCETKRRFIFSAVSKCGLGCVLKPSELPTDIAFLASSWSNWIRSRIWCPKMLRWYLFWVLNAEVFVMMLGEGVLVQALGFFKGCGQFSGIFNH